MYRVKDHDDIVIHIRWLRRGLKIGKELAGRKETPVRDERCFLL